jgi:hypothetical protein
MVQGQGYHADPTNWRRTIFDVVDEAYFARGSLPPGTVGRMFRALDVMRSDVTDHVTVERAEAIAIGLHRLSAAILADRSGNTLAATEIRHELRTMAVDWMKDTPLFH